MGVDVEEVGKLVKRARDTETSADSRNVAFSELVRRYQDMAYGFAYAMLGDFHLAQDAIQEAFILAYCRLGNLKEPEAFGGWLRKIVRTVCNRLTRRKKLPTQKQGVVENVRSYAEEASTAAEKNEQREGVQAAVLGLPKLQREVVSLFYINGYSHKEISDFLEVPVTTVKSRLEASRKHLKERMAAMVTQEFQTNKPGPEFTKTIFDGITLDKWWIDPKAAHYTIQNGELVVHNPAGKGPALKSEVGGMSWDNYRVGADVFVEENSSSGCGYSYNVQFCPNGTSVYCQMVGDGQVIIAYWDGNKEPHFTHVTVVPWKIPIRVWHRFEMQVSEGDVQIFLNGEPAAHGRVPIGTSGLLGLTVNFDSDARVRLRNLRITFLKPTPKQLQELETDALVNWENYQRKREEKEQGE